jgi:hypothetical protein
MGTRSIVVSKGNHLIDLFEKAVCLTSNDYVQSGIANCSVFGVTDAGAKCVVVISLLVLGSRRRILLAELAKASGEYKHKAYIYFRNADECMQADV